MLWSVSPARVWAMSSSYAARNPESIGFASEAGVCGSLATIPLDSWLSCMSSGVGKGTTRQLAHVGFDQ
jgi:hypothetical protein